MHTAFVVGRELVPADERTSGRHATVFARDEDFIVTNTGSRNGTFVDGEEVTSQMTAWDAPTAALGPAAISFAIFDAVRGALPIHYSLVKRCLMSAWRDRGALVSAIEAAVDRASGADKLREEHLPKVTPLRPVVPFAKLFELIMKAPPPFEIPASYH